MLPSVFFSDFEMCQPATPELFVSGEDQDCSTGGSGAWGGNPWIPPKGLGVQLCTAWKCGHSPAWGQRSCAWLGSVLWVLEEPTLSMTLPALLAMLAAWGLGGAFPVGLLSSTDPLCGCFPH